MCAGDMGVIVSGRQVAKSERERILVELTGTKLRKMEKLSFLSFLLFFEFSFKDRNRGATGRKEISDG